MTLHAADALVEVVCALCGSLQREERFREAPYSVYLCSGCGLTYVSPRIRDERLIEDVYDEEYWRSSAARTRGYGDYVGDAELMRATFRRRLRVVQRHTRGPGRALDVGCAAGFFLDVLSNVDWDVFGVEPSRSMADAAAQRLGSERVQCARFEDADHAPQSFDLITMWDVLEHLSDPVGALRQARQLLAPGGRLILETQNVNSRAAKVLGRRWHHYKHAEHLVHFEPRTLEYALEAAGLHMTELGSRRAGKYVRPGFIVERSERMHRWLPKLLAPLERIGKQAIYVNLFDEMIAVAEAH
jgi:2-polyprenyl-3-methyl-5-hydroxy-6-metoxy-1,4-benzoquinol methylase